MKPEHQELLEKLQARRKVEEQEAEQVAQRVLTDEKLDDMWERVRQTRLAAKAKPEPPAESKILLFMKWLQASPIRLALPMAALVVIAAVLMWPGGTGGDMVLAAKSTGVIERGFGSSLPSELQVNLAQGTIRLFHGNDVLSGSMKPPGLARSIKRARGFSRMFASCPNCPVPRNASTSGSS